jgi:POT family proton-dependent oligopeptide transporter
MGHVPLHPVNETAAAERARHPRGLYVLFATEMWERFSFYSAN